MRQTVRHCQLGIARAIRPVHRLEEKVAEVEAHVALGFRAFLGEDQLQLVTRPLDELGSRLRADADPVDAGRYGQCPVGLDREDRKSTRLNSSHPSSSY